MAAPQARSEFRTAAEAELLDPVVGFLREREGIIEAQRPERGFPNQTHNGTALGKFWGPKVGQILPEMTSPVAGNVVGPV